MEDQNLILRIDLSKEKVDKEPVPVEFRRKYLGGEGINARILWEHFLRVDPHIDPLSTDNVLIAGIGPFGATGLGVGSKMKFTYKSPAYNIYGDTSVGGTMGAELRWSGYDHIVITGRAKRPVYIWINGDSVEIMDASRIWGKTCTETIHAINEELGEQAGIASIGQAGENLVRFASIIIDGHRGAGRGGSGCVSGSKNLKAIAALGKNGIGFHDPKAFLQICSDFRAAVRSIDREAHMRYGTLESSRMFHTVGISTYRNNQGKMMPGEKIDKIDHNWYNENLGVRSLACSPGCSFGCGGWYHIKGNESEAAKKYAGEWGVKPEFGAANPLGAACDITDLPAISHLATMANQYGMDFMEIGMSIALLMELWERKIVTEADIREWTGESFSMEWGNYESAEKLMESIAMQKNKLGEIFNAGVYQAALRIGEIKAVDALKYASYGKGKATHEGPVRAWVPLALGCALSPIGAHHTKMLGVSAGASMKFFGKPDAGDWFTPGTTAMIGAGSMLSENISCILNSLSICWFLAMQNPEIVTFELMARALEAAIGVKLTGDEIYTAGERGVNIQKAFNSRLGLTRKDDTLCRRWMDEPMAEGTYKGIKCSDSLEIAKDDYYQWRGWDLTTGLQTRKKLEELDMMDIVKVLEKENAIV